MSRLIPISARVKNFLSFGNYWQTIPFPAGLNLLQGTNLDTEKSNGSGKSSLTEIIPFALFGKTIKDLPQAKIVNWFNRTGCKVEFTFMLGNDTYVFKRWLRPNKFIVTINGEEIVRPADIKTFQWQMEQDVIGMDFKTFKNLIHFSPNNSISILGAKKEEKRKFLESLFDLTEYSDMLKITNDKIRALDDKIKHIETSIENNGRIIDMQQTDIAETTYPDIDAIKGKIKEVEFVLKALKEVVFDTTTLESIDTQMEHLERLKVSNMELHSKKSGLTATIEGLRKRIDAIDVDTPGRQRDEINNQIDELQIEIDTTVDSEDAIADEMVQIKEEIDDYVTEKETHKEEIVKIDKRLSALDFGLAGCKDNLSTYNIRKETMSTKDLCDFCGHEISSEEGIKTFNAHFDNLIDIETTRHEEYFNEMKSLKEQKENSVEMISTIDNCLKELATNYKALKEKLHRLDIIKKEIQTLKEKLELIPDVKVLEQNIESKKVELSESEQELKDVQWKLDMNTEDIELKSKALEDAMELKRKHDTHAQKITDYERDLDNLMSNLDDMAKLYHEIGQSIKKKEKDIEDRQAEIEWWGQEITKYNRMLDHLNYLRVSLKDDNVKQFAISSILPYLNRRANYYLSESGFPYSVSVDGWLDVVIRGMGIEEVGYNSLSGGETKAMDMAVQLACGDIAELHAKTLLGISIYDEILDTSLDADGVEKLMSLLRVKQRDTGNCVFCITHRDEIKELDFDNYMMVEKENGFTVIQQ